MSLPLKSSQVISIAAVAAALLGGAYAVGRSQSAAPGTEPGEPAATAPTQPAAVQTHGSGQPRSAAGATAGHSQPALRTDSREADRLARLCETCGLVTDVHTENRQGQANGVGAVGGAVVGGLLGSVVGKGDGKKLATVAGAVAGGYAGNEIEKRERSHSVWVVQVKQADGRVRRFERSSEPGVRVGDQVSLRDGGFSLI